MFADLQLTISTTSRPRNKSTPGVCLNSFSPTRWLIVAQTDTYTYNISGRREFSQEDEMEYRIHLLHLRADESQKVQLDPSYIPTPILEKRLTHAFRVSSSTVVKYG